MNAPAFFLHLPRTAGTTLNAVLRDNFAPSEILSIYSKEDYTRHAAHEPSELRHIRLIQGHLFLPSLDPPSIYGIAVRPFTFMRDPVDRLISEYAFLRTWKRNHLYAYLNEHNTTFHQYMLGEDRPLRYRGRNYMTRCIACMDVGTDPLPRKALARAKGHLERAFGFVGIQERFTESLLLLADFLNLSSLFHEKRNALTESVKPIVSAEDLALCRELNQGDMALYAFAQELFQSRLDAQGPAFTQRLTEFTRLNAGYQKACALIQQRTEDAAEGGDILFSKDGLW